jgi:exoribonuclease-2
MGGGENTNPKDSFTQLLDSLFLNGIKYIKVMVNKILKPNEIIVFRKRREPSFGILTGELGEKVSVFSEEAKEVEVDFEKVVLSTGIKIVDELTQSEKKLRLRELRKDLEEKRDAIDLKTLWECVFDADRELTLEELVELYFGDDQLGNEDLLLFFWAVDKDDLYFKREENGYRPKTPEEVEEALKRKESERKKLIEHRAAVKWARDIIEGRELTEQEFNFTNYLQLIKGYVIHLDRFERAAEAKSFMSQIGVRDVEGAIEFLIKAGSWKEDEDPIFRRLGVDERFPKKVYEELEKIIGQPEPQDGIKDLTLLETYSIDDETTEDIDDAISVQELPEGIQVGVHITNVASIVPKWSFLDEEAARRGETIYLPERHIHMLPPELIRDKLSLFEGSPKLAISLLALFDENFNLKSYRFSKSKILVRRNLCYTEAEDFFRNISKGSKLIEIALSLRKKRIDAGALIIELPQLKIRLSDNGKILVKKIYMNTIAHIVVSEFMILMNWLSARFFKERRLPAIFRAQPEQISEEARALDERDPLFPIKAVKFFKPSRVGVSSEPHFSLGLDGYVQITSPIRRYFDLVLQRQMLGELEGEGASFTEEDIERLYMQIEVGIREKKMIERSRERYWLLKYLKDFEGKQVTGVVSSLRDRGASVYLPDYLLEVPISLSSEAVIIEGEKISLTVENVDPLRRRIVLLPASA